VTKKLAFSKFFHVKLTSFRAFRRRDGQLIATFRVQADLKGMETTTDGRSVAFSVAETGRQMAGE